MVTDSLRRRTPLGDLADELRAVCSGEAFSCWEDAFRVLTDVRRAEGVAVLGDAAGAVGVALPGIGRLTSTGDVLVLGLGPGWWMVDSPDGSTPVAGTDLMAAVDVSAARTPLVMRGAAVRDVLSHGTSLDVHPDHFGVGAAAQTMLAKAQVVLARPGADDYRVWVRASFARYLAEWLIDASVEYR